MHTHKAEQKCVSVLAFILEEGEKREQEYFLHLSFK